MGAKRDHAIALYMEGIRDGNAREAVSRYTGDRYTQHSTGVADGIEGFVAFFEDFLERTPDRDIRVLRAIEDGPHVFLHVYQNLNGGTAEWVTTDFFDTDANDKIVEHWDVIAAFCERTPSGHSAIDGATVIEDLGQTERNKRIVRNMVEGVLVDGRGGAALDALVVDDIIQHDEVLSDGLTAYAVHVTGPNPPLVYDEVVLLVGEGNFVATLCKARLHGVETAQVDLYRLRNGKVAERWSNTEPVPPREEWANGGKF